MKVIAKFIINRNEEEFYYVEKVKDNNSIKYLIYLKNKKILVFNQHNFHGIYGVDEKLSITNFAYQASLKLISGYNYDGKEREGYDKLRKVIEKVTNDKNIKNPNLGVLKADLLQGIDIYNDNLKTLNNFDYVEIPYIENYELIKEVERKTTNLEMEKISSITRKVPVIEKNYLEEKELVRNRKYDN